MDVRGPKSLKSPREMEGKNDFIITASHGPGVRGARIQSSTSHGGGGGPGGGGVALKIMRTSSIDAQTKKRERYGGGGRGGRGVRRRDNKT